MSVRPLVNGSGRSLAILLGVVIFLSVALIGASGFMKYQLDHAAAQLAAPENALGDQSDVFWKLRRFWGYGGFLGQAQKYLSTRDASGFAEMRTHIKMADALIEGLPENFPAETRRELTSIAALFDNAMQKLEAVPGDAMTMSDFTAADLAPLYAALPVLDAQAFSGNAAARLAAQDNAQFWGMLLTFACWFSVIVAVGATITMVMTLRATKSEPLKALAQSIKNMANGDMRTAIWGIERQDDIGELARSIDLARYHFSQLPDISLMSEQGPVRLRFEGGSRSLFEAMMKSISGDSKSIREQSLMLTETIKDQRESISSLSGEVSTLLKDIGERGASGTQKIEQAMVEMISSAESLKNAHAHATDQLNRLIPTIQDRAQNLTEITQLTGKQLSSTLQSLATSEIALKANTEQAKETLTKLSSTADNLSERLFGAINLLQASGKVMAETTDQVKSKWNDIVCPMAQEVSGGAWAERLEEIKGALANVQTKIDAQTDAQFGMAQALENTHQAAPTEGMEPALAPLKDRLEAIMDQLNGLQAKIAEQPNAPVENNEPVLAPLTERLETIMDQLNGLQAKMAEQPSVSPTAAAFDEGLIKAINDRVAELAELNGRVAVFISALPGDLRQALRDEIQGLADQNTATGIQEKLSALQAALEQHGGVAPQVSQQIEEIGKLLAARIDEQRASLDLILRKDVGEKLAGLENTVAATKQCADAVRVEIAQKPAAQAAFPADLQRQFLDQWFQMSAQIEASRTSLAESLTAQINEMENRLAGKTAEPVKAAADVELQVQIDKQTQILAELVATMGLLDAHVQEIKAEKCA